MEANSRCTSPLASSVIGKRLGWLPGAYARYHRRVDRFLTNYPSELVSIGVAPEKIVVFRGMADVAAIARLDRGDCVVIFPEGFMRRSEDKPLRHFGRGVWHILHERPQTPVVVCWIEGGWGSYFSYCNGPPAKNKRFDFWRRISIAVGEPQLLNPSLLADQRATRRHLMQLCLDARRYLGLEPLGKVESIQEELAEGDAV